MLVSSLLLFSIGIYCQNKTIKIQYDFFINDEKVELNQRNHKFIFENYEGTRRHETNEGFIEIPAIDTGGFVTLKYKSRVVKFKIRRYKFNEDYYIDFGIYKRPTRLKYPFKNCRNYIIKVKSICISRLSGSYIDLCYRQYYPRCKWKHEE